MARTRKSIKIETREGDSRGFIYILEELVNRLMLRDDIAEIKLIRIKNWFDHKWLNYSGKGIVHFKMTTHPDEVALKSFWKDKITVPPFTPNRVLSETRYHRIQTENKMFEKDLHRWQRSTDNQNNQIAARSDNGLFIWYSSDTETNQHGSIMGCRVENGNVDTWYLSVKNKNGWRVTMAKGIDREELKDLGE